MRKARPGNNIMSRVSQSLSRTIEAISCPVVIYKNLNVYRPLSRFAPCQSDSGSLIPQTPLGNDCKSSIPYTFKNSMRPSVDTILGTKRVLPVIWSNAKVSTVKANSDPHHAIAPPTPTTLCRPHQKACSGSNSQIGID
jgi:hypothetical protein